MNYFFILCVFLLFSSCGRGIKFHPDWYVGDHENEYLINENGNIVLPYQKEFDNFACMTKEKVKELREIFIRRCK